MATWLMKTEPATWSWDDQVKKGVEHWDGVRNFQAANFMRAMKVGDRAFFYHSGEERRIVGVVAIARPFYPDPTDETGRFGMVDVKTDRPLVTPVSLQAIKAEPRLNDLLLVRQSRLSVMPVPPEAWRLICAMGGTKP